MSDTDVQGKPGGMIADIGFLRGSRHRSRDSLAAENMDLREALTCIADARWPDTMTSTGLGRVREFARRALERHPA